MAPRQKPYGGVYENMDFEQIYGPKEFKEYPKFIPTGPHGQGTVVQTADEERDLRARMQKDEDDAPAYVAPLVADPEKEILISRCRELGAAFNPKWSKAKLKATVETAEADVDNLPAELPLQKKSKAQTHLSDEPELAEIDPETDVHATLLAEAKSIGIKAVGMHLWGIPRLKLAIAEAKRNQA